MTFSNKQNSNFICRVYGIDTPEKFNSSKMAIDSKKIGISPDIIHYAGEEATLYATKKLHIGTLYKISSINKDRYGRNLCIIYMNNQKNTYNWAIISDGYAVVYKNGKFIKDTLLKNELLMAEREAKRQKRGLWNGPTWQILEGMK